MSKRIGRREAMAVIGAAAGAVVAYGCSGSPTSPTSTAADTSTGGTTTGGTTTTGACAVTPNETAGPYPSLTDLFRSDIREGRAGTLLALTIKVVNVNAGCAAVSNANVEIWHCDAVGNYSQYGSQTSQTYLRGIQTTNANGEVMFTTIFPGWYQGRATHIHLAVTVNGASVKVTQIAFPESTNDTVHRQGAYSVNGRGTNPTSNSSDGIFADSLASELVMPTGDVSSGFMANVQIGIAIQSVTTAISA